MWDFIFKKNIHMYCHELTCKKGNLKFNCPSEDSVIDNNTVIFWVDEPPLNKTQLSGFVSALEAWGKEQDFNFKIYHERKCLVTHNKKDRQSDHLKLLVSSS